MSGTGLLRGSDPREFFTEEGCYITELSNSAADPALSVARARVEPGVQTRWHCLKGTAERYVILTGRGTVEVGDEAPAPVGPGDVVLIPPGIDQRIRNHGDTDLIFLALCSPRFRVENYQDREAERK